MAPAGRVAAAQAGHRSLSETTAAARPGAAHPLIVRRALWDIRAAVARRPAVWLIVLLTVVGLAVAAAFALWAPVVLGGLLAALLLAGTRASLGARAVVLDALRALRPLTLPLLLVAVVGAFGLGRGYQLVIGAVVAAILVPWLGARELPSAWAQLKASLRALWHEDRTAVGVFVGALALTVGLTVLLRKLLPDFDAFENRGGWPTAIAQASLFVWMGAVVLCLIGFARKPSRLPVSILAVVALGVGLAAVGLLPFRGDPPPWVLDALLVGAAILPLGCILLEAVAAELGDGGGAGPTAAAAPPPRHVRALMTATGPVLGSRSLTETVARAASVWGLMLAVVATVFLAAALTAGALSARDQSRGVADRGRSLSAQAPVPLPADSRELALTFLPVLQFSRDALWTPERVDAYLAGARLIGPEGRAVKAPGPAALPQSCPGGSVDPCYKLTIGCESVEDGCARDRRRAPRRVPYRDGAVYARVVRERDSPQTFEAVGPSAAR